MPAPFSRAVIASRQEAHRRAPHKFVIEIAWLPAHVRTSQRCRNLRPTPQPLATRRARRRVNIKHRRIPFQKFVLTGSSQKAITLYNFHHSAACLPKCLIYSRTGAAIQLAATTLGMHMHIVRRSPTTSCIILSTLHCRNSDCPHPAQHAHLDRI